MSEINTGGCTHIAVIIRPKKIVPMVIPNEGVSAMGTGASEDMGRTDRDPGLKTANYIYVSSGRRSRLRV